VQILQSATLITETINSYRVQFYFYMILGCYTLVKLRKELSREPASQI